jgi:hypothetical protein
VIYFLCFKNAFFHISGFKIEHDSIIDMKFIITVPSFSSSYSVLALKCHYMVVAGEDQIFVVARNAIMIMRRDILITGIYCSRLYWDKDYTWWPDLSRIAVKLANQRSIMLKWKIKTNNELGDEEMRKHARV